MASPGNNTEVQLYLDLKTMSSSMESQKSQTIILCTKMQETIQINENLQFELNDLKLKSVEKENFKLPSTSSSPSNEEMANLKFIQEELLDYKAMVFKKDEALKESYRICQDNSDEIDELEAMQKTPPPPFTLSHIEVVQEHCTSTSTDNRELPSSSLESHLESLQCENEKLQIENSSLLKRVVELEVTNSYVLSQLKEQENLKPLLPTPLLSNLRYIR